MTNTGKAAVNNAVIFIAHLIITVLSVKLYFYADALRLNSIIMYAFMLLLSAFLILLYFALGRFLLLRINGIKFILLSFLFPFVMTVSINLIVAVLPGELKKAVFFFNYAAVLLMGYGVHLDLSNIPFINLLIYGIVAWGYMYKMLINSKRYAKGLDDE